MHNLHMHMFVKLLHSKFVNQKKKTQRFQRGFFCRITVSIFASFMNIESLNACFQLNLHLNSFWIIVMQIHELWASQSKVEKEAEKAAIC